MEHAFWIVLAFAAVMFVVAGIGAWKRKKRQEARDAEVRAAGMREAFKGVGQSEGHLGRTSRPRSSPAYPPPYTPAPTVVREDNTGNLLMAGAIGYMLANSGNSHAGVPLSHSNPAPDLSCRPSDGDYGGGGASSSWDGGSSSDSSSYSSSDSGSSYSSSDSGGSSFSSD